MIILLIDSKVLVMPAPTSNDGVTSGNPAATPGVAVESPDERSIVMISTLDGNLNCQGWSIDPNIHKANNNSLQHLSNPSS